MVAWIVTQYQISTFKVAYLWPNNKKIIMLKAWPDFFVTYIKHSQIAKPFKKPFSKFPDWNHEMSSDSIMEADNNSSWYPPSTCGKIWLTWGFSMSPNKQSVVPFVLNVLRHFLSFSGNSYALFICRLWQAAINTWPLLAYDGIQ